MRALNYKPPIQKRNLRTYLGLPESEVREKKKKKMNAKKPGVYIPSTANIIRFATRKKNDDENENNDKETNNKNNKKRKQSKISEYTKRNETNMMIELPIPQIILIPTGKRQRKNEVSSDSIVEERNTKVIQEDIPLESETIQLQQPEQKGNDNTGNDV